MDRDIAKKKEVERKPEALRLKTGCKKNYSTRWAYFFTIHPV